MPRPSDITQHPRPARAPVALLLAASSLTVLAGAVVAPALPAIQVAFIDVPGIELQSRLVLTVPALAAALTGPLSGWLADRVGPVPTLLVGLALYALAGTTGLWVDTLPAVLGGRFALGVSVALVMTSATALLASLAGKSGRERLMGLQAAFMGAGGLVFLTLGGALAERTWRGPFAVYAVALLLVPAVVLILPRSRPEGGRPGGLPAGGGSTPTPPFLWALVASGVLGMLLFYLVPTQGPFLLQERFGANSTLVGVSLGAMTVASSACSLAFARLRRVLSGPGVLALTFALLGVGLLGLSLAPTLPLGVASLMVVGSGTGLLMPNVSSWTVSLVAPEVRGRALGRVTAGMFLGQFLSPVAVAPLMGTGLGLNDVIAVAGVLGLGLAAGVVLVWGRGGQGGAPA